MSPAYYKTILQYIIPKKIVTILCGMMADVTSVRIKNFLINNFIDAYGVNMREAIKENPDEYNCFNDFFIRHLKPDCRIVNASGVVSPVDGCISEIGVIESGQLLQAKNRLYSSQELLACDNEMAARFDAGHFATIYLSPKDYHRVHMPITGNLTQMIYVPGALFSVQPSSAKYIPKLFARNERVVAYFETELGLMAMVLVGATIVGSMGTSWHGEIKRSKTQQVFNYDETITINKAEEMGYFKLGSTVVILFARECPMSWSDGIKAGAAIKYGESIGEINRN